MARRLQQGDRNKKSHHWAFNPHFAIMLGVIGLFEPLIVNKAIAQPAETQQNNRATTARQLLEEGNKLRGQGTKEAWLQAIARYEQALKIWQELGDRNWQAATLHLLGTGYYAQSENNKAVEYYKQGLAIAQQLKNPILEAPLLLALGNAYSTLGDRQLSINFLSQAVSKFRATSEPKFEATTLQLIGNQYLGSGETQKALDFYNQALDIQTKQKDPTAQSETLASVGEVYIRLGKTDRALKSYQQALELQKQLGDLNAQAGTLRQIALVYYTAGDNQLSLDFFNQSLAIQRALEGKLTGINLAFALANRANTFTGLAGTYKSLGDRPKASASYKEALSLSRQVGNPFLEANILYQIHYLYTSSGEISKALDYLNQTLTIGRAIAVPSLQTNALNATANIYQSTGEPQKALDFYNQALEIQRQLKDRDGEAETLTGIAGLYKTLGAYDSSINTYNAALKLFRATNNIGQITFTVGNIGSAYQDAGDNRQALKYFNLALSMSRAQKNLRQQSLSLSGISAVQILAKDYDQALLTTNQILSIAQLLKEPNSEHFALIGLGVIYNRKGDYQKAVDTLNKAVSLSVAQGDISRKATAIATLGKVYSRSGNPKKAIASLNEALTLYESVQERAQAAQTLYDIAETESKRNNSLAALTQIDKAIAIIESQRTKVSSQELRTSYFASVQDYYQFKIDLLMQLHQKQPNKGYNAIALETSDRARARSLLETLTEANANIRKGVDPQLLATERRTQQQLDAIEKRRIELFNNTTPAQAANIKNQLASLKTEESTLLGQYRDIQTKIRTTSPEYAALTQPQVLTIAQIQQQLDNDTVLLEYSLGEESSYLWVVTKTTLNSYKLSKQATIESAAKTFRNAIIAPSQRYNLNRVATTRQALSKMILAPAASKLGKKRLVIVSEGELQYIPFAALSLASNLPLINEQEIVTLPSASTITALRSDKITKRQPAPKTLAILADPVFSREDDRVKQALPKTPKSITQIPIDLQLAAKSIAETGIKSDRLPETRTEAEQILKLVPKEQSSYFVDFSASRNAAINPELSQYRIVHFATHGILNSINPELSGVILSLVDDKGLSQNGFLRLHDIYNLNLPADLVVLSACRTGLGAGAKGEGLVGLTRGFMYAGAPRVVVSLWSVDDRATAELMTRFYKGMLENKLQPAAALRKAQIEMSKLPEWKSPYNWAGFVLQGEWK